MVARRWKSLVAGLVAVGLRMICLVSNGVGSVYLRYHMDPAVSEMMTLDAV